MKTTGPCTWTIIFKWSTTGVKEGDLVFVSGQSRLTGRLNTMAQLEFLRDVQYPQVLKSLARRDALLKKFSAVSPENARNAQEDMFGIENSLKAFKGYKSGLLDKDLMAKKAAEETGMRQAIASDPKKKAEVRRSLARNQQGHGRAKADLLPLTYLERPRRLPRRPGRIRSHPRARGRGEDQAQWRALARISRFRAAFARAGSVLDRANLPVAREGAARGFAGRNVGTAWPGNPVVKRALNGKKPAEQAADLIDHTKLQDVAVAKSSTKAAGRRSTPAPIR